jgi:hypothetical protein
MKGRACLWINDAFISVCFLPVLELREVGFLSRHEAIGAPTRKSDLCYRLYLDCVVCQMMNRFHFLGERKYFMITAVCPTNVLERKQSNFQSVLLATNKSPENVAKFKVS